MKETEIIDWLLEGDVSIQYQVWRDLLGVERKQLQNRIPTEGWGQSFLSKRKKNGHWGDHFYQPKWKSTHYTLLDLRNLNLPVGIEAVNETIECVLQNNIAMDGGLRLGPSTSQFSDVCVNAMFLNYAAYFKTSAIKLYPIVDAILNEKLKDGGFNCMTTRSKAHHSSLHTTLSVLEGLYEFQKLDQDYKTKEIRRAIQSTIEFILQHQLFISDRTGLIINKAFIKLCYPCRWKYDILRAMDFFQYADVPWDLRMQPALNVLKKKQNKIGTWNLNAAHPGQVHFTMEKPGSPSRWNTLRAFRVLKHYNQALR